MHNFYNMMFFHHHHLNRRTDRFFGQGKVLMAIMRKGPMPQNELLEILDSGRLLVDGMSLSKTLSELGKRRLIKRENNGEDNRSDVFSLTEKGEMFAKRFQMHDLFTKICPNRCQTMKKSS
jgi:DNA-binding MarR family transcriptional regulator